MVLTGGELPAMVMIDAVSRLVPGVLNNEESAEFESFHDNLLEHPQYTRPVEFRGRKVPDVLLSGHHGNIDKWRREQSLKRTLERRPDLIETAILSKEDEKYLKKLKKGLTFVSLFANIIKRCASVCNGIEYFHLFRHYGEVLKWLKRRPC